MPKGISRKINLQHYGGKPFETSDFWIEDENKSFEELNIELNSYIEKYITELPKQNSLFGDASVHSPVDKFKQQLDRSIYQPGVKNPPKSHPSL